MLQARDVVLQGTVGKNTFEDLKNFFYGYVMDAVVKKPFEPNGDIFETFYKNIKRESININPKNIEAEFSISINEYIAEHPIEIEMIRNWEDAKRRYKLIDIIGIFTVYRVGRYSYFAIHLSPMFGTEN